MLTGHTFVFITGLSDLVIAIKFLKKNKNFSLCFHCLLLSYGQKIPRIKLSSDFNRNFELQL